MHIRQITLDDDGMPEKITAELGRDEAVFLALLLGKQSGITSEEVMPGGSVLSHEVYGALTGELFNRYYEDGTEGAKRHALGGEPG